MFEFLKSRKKPVDEPTAESAHEPTELDPEKLNMLATAFVELCNEFELPAVLVIQVPAAPGQVEFKMAGHEPTMKALAAQIQKPVVFVPKDLRRNPRR